MFASFKPKSKSEWISQAQKELKGKNLDTLNWLFENTHFSPFFHREDLKGAAFGPLKTHNNFRIGIPIWGEDPKQCNAIAIAALNQGANAIGFYALKAQHPTFFQQLLNDIQSEWVLLDFFGISNPAFFDVALFIETLKQQEHNLSNIQGTFFANKQWRDTIWGQLPDWTVRLPQFQFLGIDLSREKTTASELLSLALEQAHSCLIRLEESGIKDGDCNRLFHFAFPMKDAFYENIAKLRAFRLLWSQFSEAWGLPSGHTPRVSAIISSDTYSADENYNTVKATTQAMSALIGGIDALYIWPSNCKIEPGGNAFSRRIALNIQHILEQESYMERVADPAAGSYCIEMLTDHLAEKAWTTFQKSYTNHEENFSG